MLFPACLPLLECKEHEGRHFCLMCSLKYSHHLQQCLAHSRHVAVSTDTAELIDKPSPQPYKDDCYYPHFKASETHSQNFLHKVNNWRVTKLGFKTTVSPQRGREERGRGKGCLSHTGLSQIHTPHQQPQPAWPLSSTKTSENCGSNWSKTSSATAVGPANSLGAQAEKQAVILLLGRK